MAETDSNWEHVSEYWIEREKKQAKLNAKNEQKYLDSINDILTVELDNIEKEINAFYAKYAGQTGLSIADVKQKVSSLDIKKYAALAKKYVKNKTFTPKANAEMKIYNLTMQVNRLQLLKATIELHMIDAANDMIDEGHKAMIEEAKKEYTRQSGILGENAQFNLDEQATALAFASFHSATYSKRIWDHQIALRNALSRILTEGLIGGKNPRYFIPKIRQKFQVSRYNAERLLITEFTRVRTQAQLQNLETAGFDEVTFVDAEDKHVCDICRGLNGQHFKTSELQVGTNLPPIHPNCRCSLAPYADYSDFDDYLKDPKSGDITYDEWLKNKLWEQKPQKVPVSWGDDFEEPYKSAEIVPGEHFEFGDASNKPRTANKLKNYRNFYVEDGLKLKPKQLKEINSLVNEAKDRLGIKDLKGTRVIIVSDTAMPIGTQGAYNALKDELKIISAINNPYEVNAENGPSYLMPETSLTVMIHELTHWQDADKHFKNGLTRTFEQYQAYKKGLEDSAKKKVFDLRKRGYNLDRISEYSFKSLDRLSYNEALTEMRTYLTLGGKYEDFRVRRI